MRSTKYAMATAGLALAGALAMACGDDAGGTVKDAGSHHLPDAHADAGKHEDGGVLGGAHMDGGSHADAAVDSASQVQADASTLQLNEAQIAGVISAANASAITFGLFAQTQGSSPAVREFGMTLVAAYTAVQLRQTNLGLESEASDTSAELSAKNERAVETLMTISSGSGFDLTLLESLVAEQTDVRNLIDTRLLPNASTPALREELTKLRSDVVTQLARAEQLLVEARAGRLPSGDAGSAANVASVSSDAGS